MNSNKSIVVAQRYLNDVEIVGKLNDENSYENIYLIKNKNNNELYVQKIVSDRNFSFFELHVHDVMRNNSHFIKLYDMIHVPGCTFWTMQYIPDGDLFDLIKNSAFRIDENKTRKLVFQLVNALNDLHSHRIIHNDIKLENLLYNRKKHKVYICDYGLSHNIDTPSTYDGTYVYFSPEKIKHEPNQVSFDWWAVGIVTYEILSRKYPYKLFNNNGDRKKTSRSSSVIDDDDFEDIEPEELLKYQRNKLRKIRRASPTANDFVQQMLCFDYTKRLNTYNAIVRHPFLKI
ncbi:pk-1 [Spodoptera frugiperda granulovirus]|uniref:non-specific serine/threonine protein kinase n=1 Tax=Spodoptera frugiperda granulovirus TaxID=307454 RepID=A0A0C5AUS3_9BBAC|nr:pk-1 [Spodoptera frugiperda granulovirus]AJK91663.1 pk-1 [Spodoptera frugiperda granulovirus]AXS01021.1 pk-1 [Spodoptera frugiperda granulovirus]